METLCVFNNFKLDDDHNEGWIKSVWDAEFVTYEEPPDEYLKYLESNDVRLLLQECRFILKAWITANCEREPPVFSWQDLMILNINVRGLLVMLGYIMKNGQRTETDQASRQACLEATSLYLMLVTIPGSNVFRVYHPNLYQKAVETLKISESLCSSGKKNSKEDAKNCTEDELCNNYVLSHSEKLKLVKDLNRIISDLIVMLRLFHFKEHTESLDITIRILLDITRLDMYVKFYDNDRQIDNQVTSLSQNAFTALQELCSSNHGTIALTIMLIAQYMLPHLLFCHTNAQSKSATIVHEAAIYFLKNLLKIHQEETAQGIVTLIHQLMVMCPERLEGRQRQAAVIIKLLNTCDEHVIATIFGDLISFSSNGKISYRLFAQEILGKLLTESFLSSNDLSENMRMKMKRILIAVVLSRCMDRSPLVRGKAMATVASFSDCNDDADKIILHDIFNTSISDKTFAAFNDLKMALSEDIDPLPGSDTFITMLLDKVNDERALVRRSTLKILRNLSVMFPSILSRTAHVISDRCRDPALMVRQFAVHVLSEILERFPHNTKLLDEWIQAVMPQIYDVESKVQEKVLECLESMLINRITSASIYIPDPANTLPWRVLDKLSNMRMRKHLSKACSLWVKNGVITQSVISNLQSHVGTDNTISAWILLAALAENMKIPTMSKYITDYKEIIQKNDFHASLILHVLRYTWSTLDRESLEDLHQYLCNYIRQFKINFNLISICLDILNNILRYLHADESNSLIESNMVELMKLSEAEIQDILEESENRAQDTRKIRAVFTLGHASLLCTNRISSSTLHALGRLLLQWESLPKAIREIKDLQASAVVLLCQQALRDREIAKEVTPIFGKLMRQESNSGSLVKSAVKINAAKALADICVRFTALVEPYLSDMCISMKDSDPAVREAIIVIFIQLLLEDFIKVKGPFFFHILTMLSDADNMIRELTTFLVEERLLAKNKTLISQQFLESIYHYNDYRSRGAFYGHRMHDAEKKLLTLPGTVNQNKRNVIYEFMLEHLDPAAKFKLIMNLTKYILCEICDGDSIDVTTEKGASVLRDALFIISNNRLQLSSFVEKHKDDAPEFDETTSPSSVPNNNATNVIIIGLKKYNLDNLLPTLVVLKKKLKTLKSPLVDEAEKLLFKIYSEYEKEHLLSLLNEYPELEKDMECYQRKSKDKNTSESDDGTSNSPSSIVSPKDSLMEICKRTTLQVSVHRLSSRIISKYRNGRSDLSNQNAESLRITTLHNTPMKNLPVNYKKLSLTELPSKSAFSSGTLVSIQNLNSDFADSTTRVSRMKKRLSEQNISSNSPRCKILRNY